MRVKRGGQKAAFFVRAGMRGAQNWVRSACNGAADCTSRSTKRCWCVRLHRWSGPPARDTPGRPLAISWT